MSILHEAVHLNDTALADYLAIKNFERGQYYVWKRLLTAPLTT